MKPQPPRTVTRFAGLRGLVLAVCLAVVQPLVLAALLGATLVAPAAAQDDPPGRVGRLATAQGTVWWWDAEGGQWAEAVRNRPLTAGDRIATAPGSRAELRIGSAVARLGAGSELEVLRLDDAAISLQLHTGSLALRLRSAEVAKEVEVLTAEARLLPMQAGHYRIDRLDDGTSASVWRGELMIDNVLGEPVRAGQRVNLYREARRGGGNVLRVATTQLPDDAFARWVLAEDAQDERFASSRYVSPEMTGSEDLDRYGRWDQHPEYGAIWLPLDVQPGWVPYRDGRWVWVSPWGWTWVDDAPWGFAPFHYGRWVHWRSGWGWVPGAYVVRPIWAPGLVAWVGGLHAGGRGVGWVPLAPRETYQPHYRVSPRYLDRINTPPPYRWQPEPTRGTVPLFGNQGAPGAVTVLPPEAFEHRAPRGGRGEGDPRAFTPSSPPPGRGAGAGRPGWQPQSSVQPMPGVQPQLPVQQPQPQPQLPYVHPQPPTTPGAQAQPQPVNPPQPRPFRPPTVGQPIPAMQPAPPAAPMLPVAPAVPLSPTPTPVQALPRVPPPGRASEKPPEKIPDRPTPPPAAAPAPAPRTEPPAAPLPRATNPERERGHEREREPREREDERRPRGGPREIQR